MQSDALLISDALSGFGIEDPSSIRSARAHLDALKLTNPNRDRVSREKLPRLLEALTGRFLLHCPNAPCVAQARAMRRESLLVRKDACQVCGGSNSKRAVQEAIDACAAAGIHKVCLVGGSPALREELQRLLGGALRLTLVDGTLTPDTKEARNHVRRHDVTIILGSSELSHKLSNNYEAHRAEGAIISVSRRGLEAIAEALTFHARQRAR